jgi:hypothetical protein
LFSESSLADHAISLMKNKAVIEKCAKAFAVRDHAGACQFPGKRD